MHISIVFIVRLAHNTSISSLARDVRTMLSANSTVTVVKSQRRAGQPPPRWAAVAQRGVALRMHIMRRSHPLALFGAKTLIASSL